MKSRHFNLFFIWYSVAVYTFFISCSDDDMQHFRPDPNPDGDMAPALIQKVNRFIWENTSDAYLWVDKLPSGIDLRYQKDPIAYFDTLKYEPDDRWSFVTDQARSTSDLFEGIETTYGYSLALAYWGDAGNIVGIIQYVSPDSPSAKAGLKRGDILCAINGKDITIDNLNDLYYSATIELTLGAYHTQSNAISVTDKKMSMTAVKMYEDPVNTYRIIEKGNKKIGYLFYTAFIQKSHDQLKKVFGEFKTAGVTDVVLDLRYNGGGTSVTAQLLSSILAPASVLDGHTIYLTNEWNAKYNAYWEKNDQTQLRRYFDPSVNDVNMNLNTLYVLTGPGTASASEATMVSLKAYLNLIQIGETTHGKYCGSFLLQPSILQNGEWVPDEEIKDWALNLIVYRFANKNGETEFKNGFTPQYQIEEQLLGEVTYPLGDEREALLSKAVELITGIPAVVSSYASTRSSTNLKFLGPDKDPRPRIRYGQMVSVNPGLKNEY